MNVLWSYFWPCFGAGLLCGVIAGIFAFRAPRVRAKATQDEIAGAVAKWNRRRQRAIIAGILASLTHQEAPMFPKYRHTPIVGPDRHRCPVCHQAAYS